VHEERLETLYDQLSRKVNTGAAGKRVGPGWLKYEWNDSIWNLDDGKLNLTVTKTWVSSLCSCTESDYSIFVWRSTGRLYKATPGTSNSASPDLGATNEAEATPTPTLHFRNPVETLPQPPDYVNVSYYAYSRPTASPMLNARPKSRTKSVRSTMSTRSKRTETNGLEDGVPIYKRQFDQFHSGNGVRTVFGKIGPVSNGMWLYLWLTD
jgi:hypothetical protein